MFLLRLINLFIIILFKCSITKTSTALVIDNERGFILYCPCMGRFGNQAEQLLGSLSFAKSLNRTLVLPPFIEHGVSQDPTLVPFEHIIQIEPIREYHSVVTLEEFVQKYAKTIWTQEYRRFYCYAPSKSYIDNRSCDARTSQPSKMFWATLNLDGIESVFYKPLRTTTALSKEWIDKYPPSNHPVLAFTGAPSPFPAHQESLELQKYIKLSVRIEESSRMFRRFHSFIDKPYISLHLRHGTDWHKACSLLNERKGLTQLFSSSQCNINNSIPLEFETCYPSLDIIVESLEDAINNYKTQYGIDVSIVHVATDVISSSLFDQLKSRQPKLRFIKTFDSKQTLRDTMIFSYWLYLYDMFKGN